MAKEEAPTGEQRKKEKGKAPGEIIEFSRHDLMKIFHRFSVKRQHRQGSGLPVSNAEIQLGRIKGKKKQLRYRAALNSAIPEVLVSDMNAMNPQDAFRKVGRVRVLTHGDDPKGWEVLPIVYRPGKAPRKPL